MKNPLILTIDFGTQSVRAGLFDAKGNIVALEKVKYDPVYTSPKPGYAEHDADFYFDSLCKATNKLVKENPEKMKDVLGISTVCFRDSVVCVDKNGKPLRPMILWLDQRRAENKEKIPLLSRFIFKIVGMGPTTDLNRKRSMAVWLQENEPEIWEKTDKFVMISTYINYKLVGEFVDSPCCQAGHMPIDFKKGEFYKNPTKHLKGQLFGVDKKRLCKLMPSGSILGKLTKEASIATGLPEGMIIYSGGSDKSGETLGLGVVDDRTAALSYGTACSLEIPRNKYSDAEPFLPAYPDIIPNNWDLEVQVYRGYWMLNWFAKEFGSGQTIEKLMDEKDTLVKLNEEMHKIKPGSEGLVLQPYWGAGLRRPLAKGAVIGFSDCHTKVHLYRAIIEGIAYCLREGLELFESKRLHHKVNKIRVSGGGSQSDAICQITADIFNRPVSRIQTYECSSLGAAMAGFIAAGVFKNKKEAANAMVHQTTEFIPNTDNAKEYDYLYNKVYVKMYPNLKDLYKNVKTFCDR